jgi:hypothetical protein
VLENAKPLTKANILRYAIVHLLFDISYVYYCFGFHGKSKKARAKSLVMLSEAKANDGSE